MPCATGPNRFLPNINPDPLATKARVLQSCHIYQEKKDLPCRSLERGTSGRRVSTFSQEPRRCMDKIEKEPAKYRSPQERKPVRARSFPSKFVSIRTQLTDQLRDNRLATLQDYRQSPGPGHYESIIGMSETIRNVASSTLQCFGSTESRSCTASKTVPRFHPIKRAKPRPDEIISQIAPKYEQKLHKAILVSPTKRRNHMNLPIPQVAGYSITPPPTLIPDDSYRITKLSICDSEPSFFAGSENIFCDDELNPYQRYF